MKHSVSTSALAAGLFAAAAAAQGTKCSHVLVPTYAHPVVARGWQAQLVAGGLTKPRSIAFDSSGSLLVVESGKGISRHSFIDHGGTCLETDHSHMVVELEELNHGLALSTDGKTLFASSAEAVFAWDYDAEGGRVVGEPRTVVANMSNSDLVTRTLLVSRKQEGMLVVSRGSAEDDAARSEDVSSGLSQVRAFDVSNLTAADDGARSSPPSSDPYYFNADGIVLGWGLRNSVGVAEHPVTGAIYAVENSADGVHRNGQDVRENNPGEELNFLGYLNGTESANQGRNFGYPHCFAVWEASEIPDNDGLAVGMQFAVQENGTHRDETCAERYVPPRLTFPAHYAPMDIKFSADGETAYITFRGSFDRSSPVGYRISSVAFDAARGEPVAAAGSRDALTAVMTNADHSACPDGCFRPVGLAFDGQGRLWMASDSTGEIYVLQRTGDLSEGRFVAPADGGDGEEKAAGASWGPGTARALAAWCVAVAAGTWLSVF